MSTASQGNPRATAGLMIDHVPAERDSDRCEPAARRLRNPAFCSRSSISKTASHGLVTTLGTASDTGIAGLTLGGDQVRLGRLRSASHATTCARMSLATADGKVQVSAQENRISTGHCASGQRGGGGGGGGGGGCLTSASSRASTTNCIRSIQRKCSREGSSIPSTKRGTSFRRSSTWQRMRPMSCICPAGSLENIPPGGAVSSGTLRPEW